MDRRSFLLGLGTAALSQSLMGCRRNATSSLQVSLLARSLPPQLVAKFQAKVPETELKLLLASSPGQLFMNLQHSLNPKNALSDRKPSLFESITHSILGGAPKMTYSLTAIGDYWLHTAITQGLIRPWAVDQLPGWNTLEPQWQRMVQRDRQGQLSATGEVWGAPYRWGATVIAYRRDKFQELGWTPTDWADLWRPELKNKISMLDQPREVIGLTLKKLNHSYNTHNLETVPNLWAELKLLNQQVKLYSSTSYLQPLMLQDTWVAVGWSTDVLAALADEPEIGFVVPRSGTALWSDIWVWPQAGASDTKLPQQWAEFWWQPEVATALTQFTDAISPVRQQTMPPGPTTQLLSSQPWFSQSELLEPLPETALQQYQTVWQQMQSG